MNDLHFFPKLLLLLLLSHAYFHLLRVAGRRESEDCRAGSDQPEAMHVPSITMCESTASRVVQNGWNGWN